MVSINKISLLYHLGYVLGRLKNSFLLVFKFLLDYFTYLQTWDAPAARVIMEYPIKFLKVESLARVRVTVLGSELAPPQPKPHFWGRENPSWHNIKTHVRVLIDKVLSGDDNLTL